MAATFHTSMGSLLLLYVPKTLFSLHSYFLPEVIFLGINVGQYQEFLAINAVKWQFKKWYIWYWCKYTLFMQLMFWSQKK
jgi:hypothetical protein